MDRWCHDIGRWSKTGYSVVYTYQYTVVCKVIPVMVYYNTINIFCMEQ